MDEWIDERTTTPPRPWTVSELSSAVKDCLEQCFPVVWVVGEVTDVSQPRSGHVYLTLKDEASQIRAVIWRSTAAGLGFRLEDGMSVVAQGDVQVYAPRGVYQLVVKQLVPQGLGALQLAFRQLHQKLAAEGLFEPARKRPLPAFPQRIGFVTSPTGAAVRDFIEVARRRWRGAHILVIPARVQGAGAATEIVAGIRAAERIRPALDALVIGRGGGSTEDLWCFNDEAVVRAVAACSLPTVSAVGHEIDVTLCDLAADVRALTPTEAAERLLPSADEARQLVAQLGERMLRPLRHRLELLRSRCAMFAERPVLARPLEMLHDRRRLVDELDLRARQAILRVHDQGKERIATWSAHLEALSPLAVLGRGYSVTQLDDGQVVTRADQLSVGTELHTALAHGRVHSRVTRLEA